MDRNRPYFGQLFIRLTKPVILSAVTNDFTGIRDKLKRANENILNLESEIARFFQEGKYPVLPEHDNKLLLEAIQYHKNRIIPLRFSVLAGEIVHHLRSCLDHVAWIFSDINRVKNTRQIEFPIFEKRPIDKDAVSLYERKVKGIANAKVLNLIESLQPYNSSDPLSSPLAIIQSFDIIDKHRELVLCVPTGAREIPKGIDSIFEAYQRQHPDLTPADIAHKFKGHGQLVPQVSFTDFGRREIQPIVPGLMELNNEIVKIMKQFDGLH